MESKAKIIVSCVMMLLNYGGKIMPSKKLEIDGPAGRQEVSDNYRDNYDLIFRKDSQTFPKKSQKGGGNHAG
jgi:hypothetical protein